MTTSDWNVPEPEVLKRASDLLDRDGDAVLATIVDVEGSAYRRPGAKMLISPEGSGIGHITAGCLEDEVRQLAEKVREAGEPRLETFDLRPEAEDDVWGLGVGCNGIIDILLEPLDASFAPALSAIESGEDIGVLTVIGGPEEGQIGARGYFDPIDDNLRSDTSIFDDLRPSLDGPLEELTARGKGDTVEVGDWRIFIDGIQAPTDLVVIGTGHDVAPIAELGYKVGYRVTVIGYRGGTAEADRFPAAHEVISTSPAQLREAFPFDSDTLVVVATHNFVDDRLTIEELLETPVEYIGLMGPDERFENMLEEFAEEGRTFDAAELQRIHTPVGLDLGGGSPYEIAVSIISEVLTVDNDRPPAHLSDKSGPIHDRQPVVTDGSAQD